MKNLGTYVAISAGALAFAAVMVAVIPVAVLYGEAQANKDMETW